MPVPVSSSLSPARMLASVPAERWRPGLGSALHNEIFASGDDAAGGGFALALALDHWRAAARDLPARKDDLRPLLWVQDRAAVRRGGRPYRPGLPPALAGRLVHVVAETPADALFALEEGVRCRDLAGVVGEIAGNPRALDFTASRRLSLAAEKHGVPLWLIRLDAGHDLSSARMRWEVRSAPSPAPRWNGAAPGMPSWAVELFRARSHPPGQWILSDDGERLHLRPRTPDATPQGDGDLARAAGDRSLAAAAVG